MDFPTYQRGESEVFDLFCRHLVALCVTYQPRDVDRSERAPLFRAYAGTLIRIQDTISILTAGHILREIDEASQSNQVVIQNAVLADTFGIGRVSDQPIPFDLKNARRFYIDDDKNGLDFGLVRLEPYYVRLLAANGMVALEEKNWVHQSEIDFDGYLMLGFPSEFSSDRLSESGEGTVAPTFIGVQRLDSPPDDVPVTRYPRFVGQINRDLPLKDMAGMSGGPIFGISYGPPTRYWIVALQSSWLRDRRIVFGCPIPILASLLTEWADESLSAGACETHNGHLS
jgi:hypothetical protein